jgi:hypothetical protein
VSLVVVILIFQCITETLQALKWRNQIVVREGGLVTQDAILDVHSAAHLANIKVPIRVCVSFSLGRLQCAA